MTFRLSNFLLVEDCDSENMVTYYRLIAINGIKKSKIGKKINDFVFVLSELDTPEEIPEKIKNQLLDYKISDTDISEITEFIKSNVDVNDENTVATNPLTEPLPEVSV